MGNSVKRVELLAPAGNFEKLETAVHYGADAVYLAGKDFSLRNFSDNFTHQELGDAVAFSHRHGVKVYIACNIYTRNHEQSAVSEYLRLLGDIGIDGVIISDPGVFAAAKEQIPRIPIHLSTQANTTNLSSVRFWERLGAARVNVARELSLAEITEISAKSSIQVEAFVHGAMCIAYSGRCLLSSFLTGRQSNRGACTHSCRWKFALVEEMRPGAYMPIQEDSRGSYILNSRDLSMIEHLPEMIRSGVSALKIEGRMKGIHYVAATVKVYREALDGYYENPQNYMVKKDWRETLADVGPRGYCTGFYFADPDQAKSNLDNEMIAPVNRFSGKVINTAGPGRVTIGVRNKIHKGDAISILRTKGAPIKDKILEILTENDRPVPFAQPGSIATLAIKTSVSCGPNDLIRTVSTPDPMETSKSSNH
jgi:U32 family peptidase